MRTIADEMADARNLGSALPIAIQDDVASDSARAAPVELVVTEERCTICVWPEVCEADSTCWEENRRRRIEAGVLITRQPPPPAAETDVAAGRQEDDDQLEEVDEMIDVRPLCKVPGCPNERHDRSGLYGAICLEHKRERQAAKAVAKASPAVAAADTPSDASPAHGVAGGGAGTDPPPEVNGDRPLTLAELAATVDAARGNVELAQEILRAALVDLHAAATVALGELDPR